MDLECINAIRALSIDAVEKANSGHPGLPLGAAPMAYVLWQNHLRHDPSNPKWPNRDRFVLSAGHGSMLLYSLLHLTGYDLSIDDLKSFRQLGSKTPGHPEFGLTPGVEATTGPLGQGLANAVGMAIAERRLSAMFNRPGRELVDHSTYALVSDGDLMEGVAAEAASLAGHLRLHKLIALYDSNGITLDGPADLAFSEDVAKRFESYGWHVETVSDGNTDLQAIDEALIRCKKQKRGPSLIVVRTTIGYGSPKKAGLASSHGSPLGAEECAATKKALGWSYPPFEIPSEVRAQFARGSERGRSSRKAWEATFTAFAQQDPQGAGLWARAWSGEAPDLSSTGALTAATNSGPAATRQSSGATLQFVSESFPEVIGGDADLSCSTNTFLKNQGSFEGATGTGRNIHYGVREHAMAAIANGISYHGGLRPFVSTFFCFSDYLKPALRLSALNHLPVIYVFTHDSVWLGEDGPTHQPIEHLAALRAIPNLVVLRPCDAVETAESWRIALRRSEGPTVIVLTRQTVAKPISPGGKTAEGAYILRSEKKNLDGILIATGSEVHRAWEVQELLWQKHIDTRLVSMPSWELFASRSDAEREVILPISCRNRASFEAASSLGWERWVGLDGEKFSIDRFGASAPEKFLVPHFEFDAASIANRLEKKFRKTNQAKT